MFKIIGDIFTLIKDVIKFILRLGWKLLVLAVILAALIFLGSKLLHLV